ncbi:MAG TPA: transposase [Candidatus Sulfotelmatobacter sp.]|nr:transposase [Candidatus Sulfotelmatobacter sp.]
MNTLSTLLSTINQSVLPAALQPLEAGASEKIALFVRVINLTEPEQLAERYHGRGVGCPPKDRLPILQAFLAKAVWNFQTTRALLDRLAYDPTLRRLCGWQKAADVPSEATFSRAFARFAQDQLPQQLHEALIKRCLGDKLLGHASTDATAIVGREKVARKPPKPPKPKARRGRLPKGEVRPAPQPTRLQVQGSRALAENLAELPRVADSGAKKNAKGVNQYWAGYKLHLSVVDGEIPVAAVLTSASLHDSQVAIPLAQMTAGRVRNLYDVRDGAYDLELIAEFSRSLGHVPLSAPNPAFGHALPLAPAQQVRFAERTTVERVNSDLKDNHGGQAVRVRGAIKVMAHLMLGVLVVAVKGLFAMLR